MNSELTITTQRCHKMKVEEVVSRNFVLCKFYVFVQYLKTIKNRNNDFYGSICIIYTI